LIGVKGFYLTPSGGGGFWTAKTVATGSKTRQFFDNLKTGPRRWVNQIVFIGHDVRLQRPAGKKLPALTLMCQC